MLEDIYDAGIAFGSPDDLDARRTLLDRLNLPLLIDIAARIHGSPCFTPNQQPVFGSKNIAFCLIFENGTRWAARIPYRKYDAHATTSMTDTMEYIRDTLPSWPIPQIHASCELEDGGGVGAPYVLMDWLTGEALVWTSSRPDLPARIHVLDQLAGYVADMLLGSANSPHHRSSVSATERILQYIDDRLIGILRGDITDCEAVDCLVQRAIAVERYISPVLCKEPWRLIHQDLYQVNLLVNKKHDIIGIIDLEDCVYRPMQLATVCPALIAVGRYHGKGDPYASDRRIYTQLFLAQLRVRGVDEELAKHLASIADNDELQLFRASLTRTVMFRQWAREYCDHSAENIRKAEGAWLKFLVLHPEWRGTRVAWLGQMME